jgi:hypothetical protein
MSVHSSFSEDNHVSNWFNIVEAVQRWNEKNKISLPPKDQSIGPNISNKDERLQAKNEQFFKRRLWGISRKKNAISLSPEVAGHRVKHERKRKWISHTDRSTIVNGKNAEKQKNRASFRFNEIMGREQQVLV